MSFTSAGASLSTIPESLQSRRVPSLNVFDNSVDQASELEIKHDGLDGLHYSVDNLIQNFLDEVERLAQVLRAQGAADSEHIHMNDVLFGPEDHDHPILAALSEYLDDLRDDHRGLLLDAFLHHVIYRCIHKLFFAGEVATLIRPGITDILESVYVHVATTGMLSCMLHSMH